MWDVIVVGAGVLGTFHALFAAERGLRTLLLERGDWPGEASVRNFGMIIASAQAPGIWHERSLASLEIYRDLARQGLVTLLHQGIQYLASTPAELAVLQGYAQRGPSLGYRCELLDLDQAQTLTPILEPRTCLATLHCPDDLTLDSRSLFRTLIPWMVERHGCSYRPRTVAIGVDRAGDHCLLRTSDGQQHSAGRVIICNGSDFLTLFPQVFAAQGLFNCKLQMLQTRPQPTISLTTALASGLSLRRYPAFAMAPAHEALLREPLAPLLERHGIHVLLVQASDGGIIAGDSHQYGSAGDALDERLQTEIEQAILDYARGMVRLPHWQVASRWYGLYPIHPSMEVFEHTIEERIQIVAGIGGKGMTCGPALARENIARLL